MADAGALETWRGEISLLAGLVDVEAARLGVAGAPLGPDGEAPSASGEEKEDEEEDEEVEAPATGVEGGMAPLPAAEGVARGAVVLVRRLRK